MVQRNPIIKPYGYIYITTNIVNGKQYIGQKSCKDPNKDDHYIGSGKALWNAVRKYGKESFIKEIIDWAHSKQELDELEKYYIRELNAVESNEYYNIQEGGGSWGTGQLSGERNPFYGKTHTEESIRKMLEHRPDQSGENNPNYGNYWSEEKKQEFSQIRRGKWVGKDNPNYGNHLTAEQRAKISKALKGKYAGENSPIYGIKRSKETRAKMSKAAKKHAQEHPWTEERRRLMSDKVSGEHNGMYGKGELIQGEHNGMYGKCHTDEAKQKMSQNHSDVSGRNNPTYGSKHPFSKQVVKLDQSKNVVCVYESLTEAERENDKCYRDGIRTACKSKGMKLYHGYFWMWESDWKEVQ